MMLGLFCQYRDGCFSLIATTSFTTFACYWQVLQGTWPLIQKTKIKAGGRQTSDTV